MSLASSGFELKRTRKLLQQWFNLSDPAMKEALYDMELFRQFAGLDNGIEGLPDESTILRFRYLLEEHELSLRIMGAVNATLIAAPIPPRTARASETLKYTRPRRATSGTSA